MPLQLFIVLVYGICCWLALAVIEPVMRSFAVEAGMSTWLFIAIPGLLAMLFAVLSYMRATTTVTTTEHSLSRALLIALLTWIAVTSMIAWLWCPWHNALRCFSNTLITTGIVGGGPLLIGAMVAGGLVAAVMKVRPAWVEFDDRPRVKPAEPEHSPLSQPDAR
jgi:hypothetical protein